MNIFVNERFLMPYGLLPVSLILPNGRVTKVLIITLGLTVFGLILHPKMAAARLLAFQSIQDQQFTELKEISHRRKNIRTLQAKIEELQEDGA